MPSATPHPMLDDLESMKIIQWADLVTLDLSKYDLPGGKQELATEIEQAVRTSGFFMVKNYNVPTISGEAAENMRTLGRSFFDLPLEEKLKFHDKAIWEAPEKRWGYRPIGGPLRKIQHQGAHKDCTQVYNISRMDGFHDYPHPAVWHEHLEQMNNFHKDANEQVVQKLLRILAILLELPDEDRLVKNHVVAAKGEDLTRFMKYGAIPIEDSQANNGIYGNAHCDASVLTLSFQQKIAGLQFCDGEGTWKWVAPYEDQILVNVGDALAALTGGYLKSGMHRIHAPPKEQIHLDRISVLYFARPNSDAIMNSVVQESPVLRKAQTTTWFGIDENLTGAEWMKVYIANQHKIDHAQVAAKEAAEKDQ